MAKAAAAPRRAAGPKRAAVRVRAHARAKPVPLRRQALQQAQQAENPTIKSIQADQAQYDANQGKQIASTQNFSQALAQLMSQAAPQTQTAYQNAASGDAAFAKGFSGELSNIAGSENANMSSILSKAGISGAPAAQALSHIGDTGDVLYGTTGFLPATGLEREGAAFTAAAAGEPEVAAGIGEQGISQIRNAQSNQDQQYATQLSSERAKIPAEAQTILNQMLSRQQQQESIDIQRGYLGNSTRSATASATGVDPVTGSAKPGYYVTKNGKVLPDGYVMRNGHPTRLSTSSKKAYDYNGALAAANSKIYSSAKGLVKTTKVSDPLPGQPTETTHEPSYAQAAKEMFNQYKYLLRAVPRGRRPAAKRVLNQTIQAALAAAGIHRSKKVAQPSQPTSPGTNP